MGIKSLISPKEKCVICGKEAGWTSFNTTIGRVCSNCMDNLSTKNINVVNIKRYSLDDLRQMCVDTSSSGDALVEQGRYSALEKLIVQNPSLSLLDGEVCFYEGSASAFHQKNVVVGSKSDSGGFSFRLSKGVSVRRGGSQSRVLREDVSQYYKGTLYITNKRIVLLAPKYGFEAPIEKITQFSQRKDGFLVYVGAKCFAVATNQVKRIVEIISLMNGAYSETEDAMQQVVSTKEASKQNDTVFSDLREYKKLFDEGVITEEEFLEKKKQLLGL